MRTSTSSFEVLRQPGRAEQNQLSFARRERRTSVALGIAFPVVMLAIWELSTRTGLLSSFEFPAPSSIARDAFDTFRDNPRGNWWNDVGVSARRIVWGYVLGAVPATVLGFAMGMSRHLRWLLEPTFNALYTVPKIALIGVFLIIFGFGERPLVVIVAVTVFFFVWIQTMAAAMATPANFKEAADSFGCSSWQKVRHVMLPAALPQVFVGYRIAAGVAVLTLVAAELVYAPGNEGIGFRINNARQVLDNRQAYVGLIVAGLAGLSFTALIRLLSRVLIRWQ